MKRLHLLMNESGEEGTGGAGAPDLAKLLQDNFKALNEKITELDTRVSNVTQKAPARVEEPEEEESLETLILVNPTKAVKRIESKVTEQVMGAVSSQNKAQQQFGAKYEELLGLYPEIGDQKSELHTYAKTLMAQSGAQAYDSGALERAVLRAAAEKGIMPMNHRKPAKEENDEDGGSYLGGSSHSGESSQRRRRDKSDKLPAASLAFAELVGLDVNDSKLVERLTKHHNDRRGNWNKYR